MDNFKPEYAGKLNFYLSAVDAQMKAPQDQPSVGLLLCKKAGKLIVEYALKNITTPIGVSEYKLTDSIPTRLKGKLPSIQQIEKGIKAANGSKIFCITHRTRRCYGILPISSVYPSPIRLVRVPSLADITQHPGTIFYISSNGLGISSRSEYSNH